MQPLKKRAVDLQAAIAQSVEQLQISAKADELASIDSQLAESDVWNNLERAQMLSKKSAIGVVSGRHHTW